MRLRTINYFIVFAVVALFVTQTVLKAEGNEKRKKNTAKS